MSGSSAALSSEALVEQGCELYACRFDVVEKSRFFIKSSPGRLGGGQ